MAEPKKEPDEWDALLDTPAEAPSVAPDEWDRLAPDGEETNSEQPKFGHTASKGESFSRGAGQGITLGFGDELSGLAGAATELGARALGNKSHQEFAGASPWEAVTKRYSLERDAMRGENETARAQNPKTFFAGELGGGLLLPVGGAVKTAAKTGSTLAAMKAGGKLGALLGAGSGLGNSRADLLKGNFLDSALDTGAGAVLGGAIGTAVPAVTGKFIPALRKFAERQAFKALTGGGGITNKAKALGLDAVSDLTSSEIAGLSGEVAKTPQALGRFALERNVLGMTPVGTTQRALLQLAGEEGVAADALKQASSKGDFAMGEFTVPEGKRLMAMNEVEKQTAGLRQKLFEALRGVGADKPWMSFEEANALKGLMNKNYNPNLDSKPAQQALNEAISLYRQELLKQAESSAGPEVASALRQANANQANLIKLKELASDAATRGDAKQSLGLVGSLLASGGAGLGGTLGGGAGAGVGAVGGLALNALRPYLPAISAKGADAAADVGSWLARRSVPTRAADAVSPRFIDWLRKRQEEAQ